MDNIDDIIFELDEEVKEVIADNPVTDALLSHLCLELESMNKPIDLTRTPRAWICVAGS